MEPGLSRGDLVLVRAGGAPRVGDVVLYRDPVLGVRLLHRVIRVDGGRLVLKGDANDFVDDARPRQADVIGSFWFSIPRAGSALAWMQEPIHAALLAFLLTVTRAVGRDRRSACLEAGAEQRVRRLRAPSRAFVLSILPVVVCLSVVVTASSVVPASKASRRTQSVDRGRSQAGGLLCDHARRHHHGIRDDQ